MKIIVKKIDDENGVWSWEIEGETKLPYKDGTGDFDSVKRLLRNDGLDSVKRLLRNDGLDKRVDNPDNLSCLDHFVC